MSIKDISKKIKPYLVEKVNLGISSVKAGLNIKEDIFIVVSIILIGLAGFGLGRLSALEKSRGEVEIKKVDISTIISSSTSTSNTSAMQMAPMSAAALVASESAKGLLVASKNGTKYHFPWCAGASQITAINKIWFDSYMEAQQAGYTAASNCKGLE